MRNPYNSHSSNKAERAKSLLCHYFQVSNADSLDDDCCTEIGEIVDCILEAVEQRSTEYKLRQAESSLRWTRENNLDLTKLLQSSVSSLENLVGKGNLDVGENVHELLEEIKTYLQE